MLCTDKQTYQVRQVQSSNSVFITQPSEKPFGSDGIPVAGISAIAHCPTLLELIPSSPPSIAFLRQNLPLYMGSESEDGVILSGVDPADPLDKQSKNNLLKDAPFSTGEFEHAWKELCAFESGDQSWIPAAQPCANCWKAIIAAATIRSLDLGEGFPTTVLAGTVEEDGHPVALLEAVLARLSADDRDMMDGHAQLDSAKCVPWVGAVLLESRTSSRTGGVGVMEFMRIWHDLLPEGWRSQASLVALEVSHGGKSCLTTSAYGRIIRGNTLKQAGPLSPSTRMGLWETLQPLQRQKRQRQKRNPIGMRNSGIQSDELRLLLKYYLIHASQHQPYFSFPSHSILAASPSP